MSEDLLDVTTHFGFGENWADYSDLVDERRIASARANVAALAGDLRGKSFLDIGSGSGLFSVAALRLGASSVVAVDIDPESVATTRKLLSSERGDWRAEQISVFDLAARIPERFDVVYSSSCFRLGWKRRAALQLPKFRAQQSQAEKIDHQNGGKKHLFELSVWTSAGLTRCAGGTKWPQSLFLAPSSRALWCSARPPRAPRLRRSSKLTPGPCSRQ